MRYRTWHTTRQLNILTQQCPTPSPFTCVLVYYMVSLRASSGLWPFATVGWPQNEGVKNSELQKFYPAAVLETGYDIIFFWVAR